VWYDHSCDEKANQPQSGVRQRLGKNIPPRHGSGGTRHVNDSLVAEHSIAKGPQTPKNPLRHLSHLLAVRIKRN